MWREVTLLDLVLITMIGLFAIANAAIHSGLVRGEHALAASFFVDVNNLRSNVLSEVSTPTPADLAELDDSADLPGWFVPSQGRNHLGNPWPLVDRVPFCTPGQVSGGCYASNPPTSGLHLGVQQGVALEGGHRVTLPPDPGIYNFGIPREVIPHIQEHAGVFVGYHCETQACAWAALELERIVRQELSLGARVVMAPSPDLPVETFGLAAWTRVDTMELETFEGERARRFIKAHSCRFDPEGFCRNAAPVN